MAAAVEPTRVLAAEVIASDVGVDLMVVDLSRLVSKWIGETEKHLDTVFGEAEASNCVLFFDEADSIFGQRGEVTRGADRYANLEVGYLLQRLERFEGLVILASNLRANLDPAFTRRFHHVAHFPRPAEPERRRLWEVALGPLVELAEPALDSRGSADGHQEAVPTRGPAAAARTARHLLPVAVMAGPPQAGPAGRRTLPVLDRQLEPPQPGVPSVDLEPTNQEVEPANSCWDRRRPQAR